MDDTSAFSPRDIEESPSLLSKEPQYAQWPLTYESPKELDNLQKDEGTLDLETQKVSEEIWDEKTRRKLEKMLENYQLKKLAYQSAYLKKLEKEGQKLEKKYISLQKASAKKQEKETKVVANVPTIKQSLLCLLPRWIPQKYK